MAGRSAQGNRRELGSTLLSLILISGAALLPGVLPQTVEVDQGSLRGTTLSVDGQPVFVFKGIPYAEAPIGKRRFKATVPHQGWTEVRVL